MLNLAQSISRVRRSSRQVNRWMDGRSDRSWPKNMSTCWCWQRHNVDIIVPLLMLLTGNMIFVKNLCVHFNPCILIWHYIGICATTDGKAWFSQEHVRLGSSGSARCSRQLGVSHCTVLHDLRWCNPASDTHAQDWAHRLDAVRRHRRLRDQRHRPRAVSPAQPRPRPWPQPRPQWPWPKESCFSKITGWQQQRLLTMEWLLNWCHWKVCMCVSKQGNTNTNSFCSFRSFCMCVYIIANRSCNTMITGSCCIR